MYNFLPLMATFFLFVGAVFSFVIPSAASSAVVSSPVIPSFVPRSDDFCASRGNSTAPEPSSGSISSFMEDTKYNQLALSAPIPTGYSLAMSNANCAFSSTRYMLYVQLDSYNPDTCAELCNRHEGCDSFNIYVQRDPSLIPGPACPNPASIAVTKCALYSEPEKVSSCTNFGQHIGPVDADGEAFKIAMRASNAYNKVSVKQVYATVTTTVTETVHHHERRLKTVLVEPNYAEYDSTTTVRISKITPVCVGPQTVNAPASIVTVTGYINNYTGTTTITSGEPSSTTTTITLPASTVTITSTGADMTTTVYNKRDIAAAQKGKKDGEERWDFFTRVGTNVWRPAPHCCDTTTTVYRGENFATAAFFASVARRDDSEVPSVLVNPSPFTVPAGPFTTTMILGNPTTTITEEITITLPIPMIIDAGTYSSPSWTTHMPSFTTKTRTRSEAGAAATATLVVSPVGTAPAPMKTVTLDDSYTYTGPTGVPMKTVTLRA